MKIQAVNSISNCTPVKPVEFTKRKQKPVITEAPALQDDLFSSSQNVTEQKYNFACRLAAYYKTQYEELLKTGVCNA